MTDKRTVLVGARPDAVERRRVAREDRRLRHAQDLDWVLIAAALTLTVVGIVLVASAGSGGADLDAGIQMAQRHGVTALIGVIGAYVASRTPYHLLHVAAPWVYLVTVAFTLLPLHELAPDLVIPGIGAVAELLPNVADQRIEKTSMCQCMRATPAA